MGDVGVWHADAEFLGRRRDAAVPADTDPALLVEFLVAPTYLRLLLLDGPLDDELIDQSVRGTIAAFTESR